MTAPTTRAAPRRSPRPSRRRRPSLALERELLAEGRTLVAGMDEVGRGALAGPVSVGVAVVTVDTGRIPAGLRDSKLLPPSARQRLVPGITRWASACGVGHAGPDEIDEVGILAALRLAGLRALAALPVRPDVVLLDGNYDWLGRGGQEDLFAVDDAAPAPPVVTRIKADLACASVAAASVLAKTERDALMVRLAPEHPQFAWDENKGYSAPVHLAALEEHGPCVHHRRSWRVGAYGPGPDDVVDLTVLDDSDDLDHDGDDGDGRAGRQTGNARRVGAR